MDVLNRRMFQAGGSAVSSNVLGRGSGFTSARPGMRRFERDADGNVLFTTYDTAGNIIQEELVDMSLSATGDPEEALARQRQNKAASTGVDAALTLVGGRAAKFGVDQFMKTPAGKATRDVLAKAAEAPINLGKKGIEALLPFKLTQKFVANPKVGQPKTDIFGRPIMQDGKPVLETAKKLEDRSLFNLQNIKDGGFEVKPFTSTLYGVPTFLGARSGLQDLVTQEPEMAEIMDREVEDSIQAGIDGLQPTPAPTPAPTPEPTPEPEEEIEQEQQEAQGQQRAQVAANSLSNFFSSSAFNDALRNIGGSLVREGRFGAGLASGAASFADEQEAKSLLEQERLRELSLIAAEKANQGISTSDAKNNAEFNAKGNTAVTDFNKTSNNLARLQYAIGKVDETAVGFKGLFGKGFEMLQSFTNQNYNKNFEDLDSRTQVDAIVNALRQENIRDILGESGRTISNLDREIVAEIFGSIKSTTSAAEIKSKLREIEKRFRNSLEKSKNDILETIDYFGQTGMTSSSLLANAERIKDILNIQDYSKYSPPVYNPSGSPVVDSGAKGARVTSVDYITSGG